MKTITSPANETYTAFLKLYKKKYRDRTGEYPAEGVKITGEALANGAEICRVFIREDFGGEENQRQLLERIKAEGIDIVKLPARLFDASSDEKTPQGITAVVKKRVYAPSDGENFFSDGGSALILDRLQDPGNIGSIIRTASAAGFGNIIAVKGTGDIFSPKVTRAAAGALFRVRIMLAGGSGEAADAVKAAGLKLVCTAPGARRSLYDTDLSGRLALVVGNEGGGVCGSFLENSDINISLPMENNTESLNASAAAAVAMYEAFRQRRVLRLQIGGNEIDHRSTQRNT